ncbi:MAG: serine--tRNA ligase [Alphaproteobacteria bacterium]|nr:MAG: serine--tRNA ligase [Alphaproteobacteria bacterium]TAF77335.1 MAG: serine--tRNA ligase [Alphaproteobacteria bacterium]
MHDIRWIRNDPHAFDDACAKRGLEKIAQHILTLDEQKRGRITQQERLLSERNQLAKDIGAKKKSGENADDLMEYSRDLNERIKELTEQLEQHNSLDELLSTLPNIVAEDVPLGADEQHNIESHRYGIKPSYSFTPKQHFDLGEALGLMDFEGAAKISGARFVVLRGALARLERALAQFMLDTHTQHFHYQEISPPMLVKDHALYGTGQLPKFSQDCFQTHDGYWLIPTAEVPLTNLVYDTLLNEEQLPLRFTAHTPCFRSEAGSAGRDTRGMIRQHQFSKVELVSITRPEDSQAEHKYMLAAAESILQQLGLHYRVMTLCAGDTGFSAAKTFDIEVWLSGQDAYREISSISNCHGFQARRINARFKRKESKTTEMVHTLNGSGLAIGRTLVAIMEHYQQEDGSIIIPEVLRPYMGGMQIIPMLCTA